MKTNRNKRLLSLFIVVCMILTLLPISSKRALAGEGPVLYSVWVGGVQVTSENKDNITGDGITGTVTYTPETQTLAVSGAAITGAYTGAPSSSGYDTKFALYTTGAMNIELIGSNTVSGVSESAITYGIYSTGALTISGTGSLAISGGSNAAASYGIYSDGDVTISSGTITVSDDSQYTSICINGRDVRISGGIVNATASGSNPFGIYASNTVYITGGTVTATSNGDGLRSKAIFGDSGVTITGGTVTASANTTSTSPSASVMAIEGTFTTPSNGILSASINYSGTPLVDPYNPDDLASYKYLHYLEDPNIALVASAKTAVIGGIIYVGSGADQTVKTAAVQSYVNGLLTGDVAGVTANVTHDSDNIYNVALSKGSVNDSKTITMTINEGDNPDIALVASAKTLIEDGSYTMTQTVANTEVGVKAELARQINGLSGMSATGITVAASDIMVSSITSAEAGTAANPTGTIGSFNFTVALSKGVVTDTTASRTGTIIATAYTGLTDAQAVASAKTLIEDGSYTMTQTVANTEVGVATELARQINGLSGMSATGVTLAASDITVSSITSAEAGTAANPTGTIGSFNFTVALSKEVVTDTTASRTGTITATAYTGLTDAQAVAAAKTAVVDGAVNVDFGANQTAKTSAVQSYVNGLLTGNAAGVTAVATHDSNNIYNVALSKGSENDSKTITMTINEGVNPDIALVASAKTLIEDGSYTMTQTVANTEVGVATELARQINGLSGMSATGVTATASDITVSSITSAEAGTAANPTGTNGSFNFTVALSKGVVTDTTASRIGTITATAYTSTPTPTTISTPTPTPTPTPEVKTQISKDDFKVELRLTAEYINHFNGQIILPITSEEMLNQMENTELSGIQVGLSLPKQGDDLEYDELNLILKSEVIQKAKENNKNISVDVNDSKNKVLYSWTFDKTELTNSDKDIEDVNISLKVEKPSESAQLVDELKEHKDVNSLVVDFAHEGILPSQASVRIYVADQEGITPGSKVYLYHYNEKIGKLETFPYGYQVTVDSDGYITFNILQCSDYLVYTEEADSKLYVSLRKQIKVTPTKRTLSLTESEESTQIEIKLPVTLEWVRSLDDDTSQSTLGGVTVSFASSDNQIATVDSEGNITAKAPGTVVITTTITLYSKKTKKVETLINVKL